MHAFFKTLVVAGLAAIVHSAAVQRNKNILEVTLTPGDNAVVHATVKNVGVETLNLLSYGTLFDPAPVQKLNVYEGETAVPFQGLVSTIQYTDLAPEVFHTLAVGETFETTVNTAEVHDLSTSTYTFVATGAIPVAAVGSTELTSSIVFKSNTLTMNIDGTAAKSIAKAIPTHNDPRTVIQSDCTGTQLSQVTEALTNCAMMAKYAWTVVYAGNRTKFAVYYKDSSVATRTIVAARLIAVENECNSRAAGNTKYHCTDVYGYCKPNVLAYTLPSINTIVNCPLYYSLPAHSSVCHVQDRATTLIRELTHAPGTYSPGTLDYAYGHEAVLALSGPQAILNADTYALYVNAVYTGCD
ncbi:hypothetical protein EYC80_001964 [Monilinia laxa]|uniref:Neutral protease 2 n=1 Tax=Monilinia laxa TaxID=61186 RepID=A0A5N6K6S7_MONLA|nr:hypothetical protein EYC80_001964 [Monilinia laxa]